MIIFSEIINEKGAKMALRKPYNTAVIIALLMKRSGQTRARISAKTIKLAAKRTNLRTAFIKAVSDALSGYFDITLVEINNGGFGLIKSSALEGAKSITMKSLFTPDEKNKLRKMEFDFDAAEEEIMPDPFDFDDSEF
ncbi:hypothetical protein AA18889_0318 [Acetobacter senegalensis DSM 18889]|nr:hypothetical protein AA18889_0318 [Acetobacter senegalensis DSM 18889]